MCGRYQFTAEQCAEIRQIVETIQQKYGAGQWTPGEIRPTAKAPVLVREDSGPSPALMKWGYQLPGTLVINARAETAAEKPMFRRSLATQRCLIPAAAFYEWDAEKRKYQFSLPGEDILFMAGLFDRRGGEDCYCILTTAANGSMKPIHDRMPLVLPRSQAEYCQKAISEGMSVILHGKAGEGKSGCVHNLIHILEDLSIPYLAIKLDYRVPKGTSSNWGKEIGLPDSVSYCLDAVVNERNGVLILDQLDALRWTQSHSGEALSVCMEIIREVANINLEREKKISVVMVCRTYDLENDRNINRLFMHEEGSVSLEWEKIAVGKLSAELQTASNLYIWEQLDKSKNYSEIQTTQQLIQRWWDELLSKAEKAGIQEEKLNEVKNIFVNFCDKYGKITVPRALLNVSSDSRDFLQTNRFFVVNDNVVSLAHQSILDYFLVQNMLEKVCKDCSIEEIIGGKEKQTPGRRYQVQMLFQQLQEIWPEKFLGMGEMLLNSESIRFNLKYVFIEILSQIEQPDQEIFLFVKKYIQNPEWQIHFLDGVVLGKKQYLIFLRDTGVLDAWMESEKLQDQVIRLYASISPDFDNADIGFIEKYALKEKKNIKWGNCFLRNIDEDSDELFELRLKMYDKYPDLLEYNVDIISMLKECQIRTVRILALMLEKQKKRNGETLYQYEEELVSEDAGLFNSSYREVVSILLPCVPLNESDLTTIYAWSAQYMSKYALERTCIEILKKANH